MIKKVFFLITFSFYLSFPFAVYADLSQSIKEPFIKPNGDIFYQIERVYEKILEKFQFSDNAKLNYHQNLMMTRLSELKYIAEKKDLEQLQKATERFSYEAGKAAQIAKKLNSNDKDSLKNQFREYKPVLEKLRDLYSYHSSFFRLVQYDIDTLDILSKELGS